MKSNMILHNIQLLLFKNHKTKKHKNQLLKILNYLNMNTTATRIT